MARRKIVNKKYSGSTFSLVLVMLLVFAAGFFVAKSAKVGSSLNGSPKRVLSKSDQPAPANSLAFNQSKKLKSLKHAKKNKNMKVAKKLKLKSKNRKHLARN